MFTPLDLAINTVTSLQTKFNSEMPDLHTWINVKMNTALEARIDLMIGESASPALFVISLSSHIPTEKFSERMLEIQVKSSAWLGEKLRIPNEKEINDILREEYKLVPDPDRIFLGPVIIKQEYYRYNTKSHEDIEVKFQSIARLIDLEGDIERFDYKELSEIVYQDLISIRRIYEQLRQN